MKQPAHLSDVDCGSSCQGQVLSLIRSAEHRDGAAKQDGALAHIGEAIPNVLEHIQQL